MKVEVIKNEDLKNKYPCIMHNKSTGNIILFHKEGCGIVISKGALSIQQVGYYTDEWVVSELEPFTGKLVLSNE